MPNEKLQDYFRRRDGLIALKQRIQERMATATEAEKIEMWKYTERATQPECWSDRTFAKQLHTLALFPDHVGDVFRFCLGIHDLFHRQ